MALSLYKESVIMILENATPEEKKRQLFLQQKQLLDTFLEKHAISQAQYDKSLGDLREKMGMHGVQ